jgi:tripartite ATP-independent transporter DctP family solute receptor
MNKKKFIILIAVLAIITLIFYMGFNKSLRIEKKTENAIILRLADIQPEGYPTVLGDLEFARQLEKTTNGRIKIKVYPLGKLGDENSTIEQAKFGAIDIIRVSAAPLVQYNKQMEVVLLPYIFKDKDQMFRVLDGSIGEKLFSDLETDTNLVGLAWLDAGARNFYNTKKEIKTTKDLSGLKIRVQESQPMVQMVEALGSISTPMTTGDVYSSLEAGVIDGAENNLPSYISFEHYKVAKYITIDEHNRIPELIAMSKFTWDKISPEDQKLVMDAAKEGAKVERTEWTRQESAALENIEKDGAVTITKLSNPKEFQDAVEFLYSEYNEYKALIEEILQTK